MRLGLLGGTFNPIHEGHLAIARAARVGLKLDSVVLVPAARPPHKAHDTSLAPAEDRLAMTRLAAASEPGLEVSGIELERTGPSFTIDTVRAFLARDPGVELYFIIGCDTLPELATWRAARELLSLARFAVVARPGRELEADLARFERDFGTEAARAVRERIVPMEPAAVSATEVRARVAGGKPIEGLVPGAVAEYIRAHRLYGAEQVAR
jgi:nicotinate-nucleotide adenylyltransferase